ncbi:acylphosphatase [Arthrobacter crystallopoietes BAB-32]|uniref:acylphosphatase n=1 Tax=Arthrobacter crystallopoietes BAB-32 TaxID=1246476 RepID=N1UW59_9MICC|nr:acylphosphatase [Arthrobacter crystallopoietes]EMY34641.1 acylphosphatase [Arthrobacter crystallopoietes BAB-32]
MAENDKTGRRTRLLARVSGRVQGVGFRYWTRDQADRLGLTGAAVNQPDGSVKIIAEGSEEAVEVLRLELASGRTPGKVERLETTYSHATGEFSAFGVG